MCLTQLKKLSVSHNKVPPLLPYVTYSMVKLQIIPNLTKLAYLTELRLTGNRIMRIPEHIGFMPSLKILDIGANYLRTERLYFCKRRFLILKK